MRYAAIDIGSNAVRLLIADIIELNTISFKKNTLIRVPLRLGDDAFLDKRISARKAADLVKTMAAFRHLMDVYKVSDYLACATSAMREAENGELVAQKIRTETSINLEIVEGDREAQIIYAAHIERTLDKRKNYLYIDVGGGSTELSIFSGGEMVASHSFNIGTIRILDNRDDDQDWIAMKEFVKEHARQFKGFCGIGTGGNINKLFRLSEEKEGAALSFAKLNKLYAYLESFSLRDRIHVLGLNQDRADVIIPACQIYTSVMKWGNVKEIYVPKTGLVDGVIQLLIEKNFRQTDHLALDK